MDFNDNLRQQQPNSLQTSAEIYLSLGWSVIPTCGKVAAVPWKPYQSRKPSPKQLTRWFAEGGHTGLAIVTGGISSLAVLDFDNAQAFRAFTSAHPYLGQTRTVQTRRGHHLYFCVPPQICLSSHRVPGIDLQYAGCYVIAPPSIVDGHQYRLVQGGMPRTLSQGDVDGIRRFLSAQQGRAKALAGRVENSHHWSHEPVDTATPADPATIRPAEASLGRSDQESAQHISLDDLVALYPGAAARIGRNRALFRLSCLGRDNGLTQEQVIQGLAHRHACQPPNGDHRRESDKQRRREALRTITSVFCRQPRSSRHDWPEPTQLPNPVREALLGLKLSCVLRTIEGLRLRGVRPGQPFTRKQAVLLLQGIVGQGSIYKALNAVTFADKPLFEPCSSPLPRTPSSHTYGVAADSGPETNSLCLELRVQKPLKSRSAHRPVTYLLMPGNRELARKLAVRHSTICDPISLDDLASTKKTRMALHTGFIRRKPGVHTMNFFAGRLGSCVRTVQNYHAEDKNIRREPVYSTQRIYWMNVATAIPNQLPHRGFFLTDSQGKKYPAQSAIARKLLARKQRVVLHRQLGNYWWYGDANSEMPVPLLVDYQNRLENIEKEAAHRQSYLIQHCDPYRMIRRKSGQDEHINGSILGRESLPVGVVVGGNRLPRLGRRLNYRQPLPDPDAEALVGYVRGKINQMSDGDENRMSLFSARKLVDCYGPDAVRRGLKVAARRKNLIRPAGFILTLLRSERAARSRRG